MTDTPESPTPSPGQLPGRATHGPCGPAFSAHDPSKYRNHGDEIAALLKWRDEQRKDAE